MDSSSHQLTPGGHCKSREDWRCQNTTYMKFGQTVDPGQLDDRKWNGALPSAMLAIPLKDIWLHLLTHHTEGREMVNRPLENRTPVFFGCTTIRVRDQKTVLR